ncbi:MAG: D-alanyl-lipoteichoic acid biosynthesis protein DltD [Coriobacteriales bacterium]|nr:D-alanyl-lipoteichoic acid biosynthesis protein DltD [Coriobacteriales bacterium]
MEARTLHRRLAALLAGVLVAVVAVVATFVLLPAQASHDESRDYGYVYSGAKSASVDFVRSCMGDDSLLMLGSSEFSTPASLVPEIPAQVLGAHNYGVRAMLVGEAFDQCLWDCMALGALAEDGLPRNKVVLIVGLGQFTDGGLDNASFGERFSYPLYDAFCSNEKIPEQIRSYVRTRLAEQGIDGTTLRAGAAGSSLAQADGTPAPLALVDVLNDIVFSGMGDLRLRADLIDVRSRSIERASGELEQPDWEAWRAQGLADAQRMSTTNDWGAEDAFWTKQLAPALDSLAGARAAETYTQTPEYNDLNCFLLVCEACGVEPLVVIQPVMGPYYDHVGISSETRNAAYQRIRDVVAAHPSARLADFSDREYEKYFLFDIVHFGWTGWIDAQHAIYDFAQS